MLICAPPPRKGQHAHGSRRVGGAAWLDGRGGLLLETACFLHGWRLEVSGRAGLLAARAASVQCPVAGVLTAHSHGTTGCCTDTRLEHTQAGRPGCTGQRRGARPGGRARARAAAHHAGFGAAVALVDGHQQRVAQECDDLRRGRRAAGGRVHQAAAHVALAELAHDLLRARARAGLPGLAGSPQRRARATGARGASAGSPASMGPGAGGGAADFAAELRGGQRASLAASAPGASLTRHSWECQVRSCCSSSHVSAAQL